MKISIILVLAFALFAQAAYAEDKPAPKLTKITGYGEYKLGTPTSQYDLKEFTKLRETRNKGPEVVNWYVKETTFMYDGKTRPWNLGLIVVDGKLVAIRIGSSLTKEEIDQEHNASDFSAYRSFVQNLRQTYLDKYSPELVVSDTLVFKDELMNEGTGVLLLADKEGNTLSLELEEPGLFITYRMKSSVYDEIFPEADIKATGNNLGDDKGKL